MSLFVEAEAKIQTGESVQLAITQANHISITGQVVVTGIEYNVHGHYFCQKGTWSFRNDGDMSISGSFRSDAPKSHWNKRPAPTVRAKITKMYQDVCDTYIAANPEAFLLAEAKHLDHDIAGVEMNIAKLELELQCQKNKLLALVEQRYPQPVSQPFAKGTLEAELYASVHARFLEEQTHGFVDDRGVTHPAVSAKTAGILFRRSYLKIVDNVKASAPEVALRRKEHAARQPDAQKLRTRIMQEA